MGGVRLRDYCAPNPAHFDSQQIAQFYRGFHSRQRNGVYLVGYQRGESLIISVCDRACSYAYSPRRRSGDDIYVTGTLGDSALAKILEAKPGTETRPLAKLLVRHHRPTPRLAAGAALARGKLATAMIDVSDGLLQDLGHICKASDIGALIWNEQLPISPAYRKLAGQEGTRYALSGGEDYELLFCARPRVRAQIGNLAKIVKVPIARIGTCVPAKKGIIVIDGAGREIASRTKGHDHFRKN
jgi:thiamine-monophosphate kinase